MAKNRWMFSLLSRSVLDELKRSSVYCVSSLYVAITACIMYADRINELHVFSYAVHSAAPGPAWWEKLIQVYRTLCGKNQPNDSCANERSDGRRAT